MKDSKNYYSQHGEDYIAAEILKNYAGSNFFVEVGCIDGKRFSNTLHFAEKGWKGVSIEAHNDYIKPLRENRPDSIVVHCAVGESDEENVNFYANSRGSLSTLDKSQEKYFEEKYGKFFTGFDDQIVQKKTLNTIFKEHDIKKIDLLSIDIEGYEIEALQGLDLKTYRPSLVLIESDSAEHEKKIKSTLNSNNYRFLFRLKSNLFFIENSFEPSIDQLKNKSIIDLIYTEHPLDKGGDQVVKVGLELRDENILFTKESFSNKIRNFIKRLSK